MWRWIDLSPFKWNFDLDKSGQKFHHNLKEHHKISNIPPEVSLQNVVKCGLYSLAKFAVFHSVILHYKWEIDNQMIKLIINFPFVIQNDWKTANFARLYILSAFYNISQQNFGILLILWCSFKLWWNFCPDLSRSKFHLKGERSIGNAYSDWRIIDCIVYFILAPMASFSCGYNYSLVFRVQHG
jgi:hypothetical protein